MSKAPQNAGVPTGKRDHLKTPSDPSVIRQFEWRTSSLRSRDYSLLNPMSRFVPLRG